MIELPSIGVKYRTYEVTCELANGTRVDPGAVDATICPFGQGPTRDSQWVHADYADMLFRVLLVGAKVTVSSPPACALQVPLHGGDLWARVIDGSETDAALVEHVYVA